MSEVNLGGWAGVKFGEIDVPADGFADIPDGEYTFQLLPAAKYRQQDFDGKTFVSTNATAAIAEGDLSGRRVFFEFPDPSATNKDGKPKTWSSQMLKKLSIVMGIDIEDGEAPVAYLNRAAGSGNARFVAKLGTRTWVKQDGSENKRQELNLFSFKPAA